MRFLILFLAGYSYFIFRLLLHGWSIDIYSWSVLHGNKILFADHVFLGDPNKLFEALVGLIPAYFDKPIIFPLISAAFGSFTCIAVYELILSLTRNKGHALMAWGVVLLAPVLHWQVLACNSILFATSFAVSSLYYFTAGKSTKGSILLSFAALSRPEPFVFIPLAFIYLLYQWKTRVISFQRFSGVLVALAVPPAIWLVVNFFQTDNALYAFNLAQDYTKQTHQNIDAIEFPKRLWWHMTTFYFNPVAIVICALGFLVLVKKFRKLIFIYAYVILSIGGYWVLAPFNIPLLERYVLPISIYMTIFGVLLFSELESKWIGGSIESRGSMLKSASLILIFLAIFINPVLQHASNQIINYHKSFDRDIPLASKQIRKILSETESEKIRILISDRRRPHYNYLLFDVKPRLEFFAYRELYYTKTNLKKKDLDYVIYAPDDLYPLKSAFYTFNMLSEEGLEQQGLEIKDTIKLSESTKMFRLSVKH